VGFNATLLMLTFVLLLSWLWWWKNVHEAKCSSLWTKNKAVSDPFLTVQRREQVPQALKHTDELSACFSTSVFDGLGEACLASSICAHYHHRVHIVGQVHHTLAWC
jgi:hypothetical protein